MFADADVAVEVAARRSAVSGLAFAASVTIGILAGLIPAFRASRMNVIQALRYD